MELSQHKRNKFLIILIEGVNILIALILLSFYSLVSINSLIVYFAILIILTIANMSIRFRVYSDPLVIYSGILAFFIPVSISLNYTDLSLNHFIIAGILLCPFFCIFILEKGNPVLKPEHIRFSVFTFLFLLVMIIFTYYYPIKPEYVVRRDILNLVSKAIYLLLILFLLFINFRVFEYFRQIDNLFFNSNKLIFIFSIILMSLSLFDTLHLKSLANDCINKRFVGCSLMVEEISKLMRQKGLDTQNVLFLNRRIEYGINRDEINTISVIEFAEKMYPYECKFYLSKILYYEKFGMQQKIREFIDNIPAPAKKRCSKLIEERIGER